MHISIVGAGDTGIPLIDAAARFGDEVVIVERDSQDKLLTLRGNTRTEANSLLAVYSATGAGPGLADIFGHYEDQAA